MMAFVGDEDVAGLQVQMQHLLAMKIGHGVKQFVQQLPAVLFAIEEIGVLGGKKLQVFAIHIIHLDERSSFVFAVIEIAHDIGMLQLDTEGKLLSEEVHVVLRLSPSGLRSLDAIGAVADDALVAVGSASATQQHFSTVSQGLGGKFGIFGHGLVVNA